MTESDHTKLCTNCKIIKPLSSFYRRGNGYRSHCIDCFSDKYKHRGDNRPSDVPGQKICGSCGETKTKDEFHRHRRSHDGLAAICKSCKKDYDEKNKERFANRKQSAPTSTTEYRRRWNKENIELKRSYTANRRALIKSATPPFADMDAIRDIYLNCPAGYEVDHIIPLQSKVECGLHVHWNMQNLTRVENIRKGNKHELL